MMRRVGGVLLTGTGILTCPCHLILTLPLLAGLFAGTAFGSFLTHHTGLVFVFASLYFIVALVLGFQLLMSSSRRTSTMDGACPTCLSMEPVEISRERDVSSDNVPATRSMQ